MKYLTLLCLFACSSGDRALPRVSASLSKQHPLLAGVDIERFVLDIKCDAQKDSISGRVGQSGDVYTIDTPLSACEHARSTLSIALMTPTQVMALRGQAEALLAGDVEVTFVVDPVGEVDLVGTPGAECTAPDGTTARVPGRMVLPQGPQELSCSFLTEKFVKNVTVEVGKRTALDLRMNAPGAGVAQLFRVTPAVIDVTAGNSLPDLHFQLRDANGAVAPLDDVLVELSTMQQVLASGTTKAGDVFLRPVAFQRSGNYVVVAKAIVNSQTLLSQPTDIHVTGGMAKTLTLMGPSQASATVATNFTLSVRDSFDNAPSDLSGEALLTTTPMIAGFPSKVQFNMAGDATFSGTFPSAGTVRIDAIYAGVSTFAGITILDFNMVNKIEVIIAPTGVAGVVTNVLVEARNASDVKVATFNQSGGTLTTNDPQLGSFPVNIVGGSTTVPVTFKTAGTRTVNVNVNPFGGMKNIQVAAAAASKILVNGPTNFGACAATGNVFQAFAADQFNNPIIPYSGTFTVITGDPLIGTISSIDAQVNQPIMYTTAGSYTLTVTANPFLPTGSRGLNVSGSAVSQLSIIQQPTNAPVLASITPPPRVQLRNSCGGEEHVGGVQVNASFQFNPGGAQLVGPTGVSTDAFGRATFNNLQIDTASFGYSLHFDAGGVSTDSNTFDIGAPIVLHVLSGASGPSMDGSPTFPYGSITQAITAASGDLDVRVAEGLYIEALSVDRLVKIGGGWSSDFLTNNPSTFITVLMPPTSPGVSFSMGTAPGSAIFGFYFDPSAAADGLTMLQVGSSSFADIINNRISNSKDGTAVHINPGAIQVKVANNLIHTGVNVPTGNGTGVLAESSNTSIIVNNTFFISQGDTAVDVNNGSVAISANYIAGALNCPTDTCAFRRAGSNSWSVQSNVIAHCSFGTPTLGMDGAVAVTGIDEIDGVGIAFDDNRIFDDAVCNTATYGLTNLEGGDANALTFTIATAQDSLQRWAAAPTGALIVRDTTGPFCGPAGNQLCGAPDHDIENQDRKLVFRAGAYITP